MNTPSSSREPSNATVTFDAARRIHACSVMLRRSMAIRPSLSLSNCPNICALSATVGCQSNEMLFSPSIVPMRSAYSLMSPMLATA